MKAYVYESAKKRSWWLILTAKDDFTGVGDADLSAYGQPVFVKEIDAGDPLLIALRPIDLETLKSDGYVFVQTRAGFTEC